MAFVQPPTNASARQLHAWSILPATLKPLAADQPNKCVHGILRRFTILWATRRERTFLEMLQSSRIQCGKNYSTLTTPSTKQRRAFIAEWRPTMRLFQRLTVACRHEVANEGSSGSRVQPLPRPERGPKLWVVGESVKARGKDPGTAHPSSQEGKTGVDRRVAVVPSISPVAEDQDVSVTQNRDIDVYLFYRADTPHLVTDDVKDLERFEFTNHRAFDFSNAVSTNGTPPSTCVTPRTAATSKLSENRGIRPDQHFGVRQHCALPSIRADGQAMPRHRKDQDGNPYVEQIWSVRSKERYWIWLMNAIGSAFRALILGKPSDDMADRCLATLRYSKNLNISTGGYASAGPPCRRALTSVKAGGAVHNPGPEAHRRTARTGGGKDQWTTVVLRVPRPSAQNKKKEMVALDQSSTSTLRRPEFTWSSRELPEQILQQNAHIRFESRAGNARRGRVVTPRRKVERVKAWLKAKITSCFGSKVDDQQDLRTQNQTKP
ncbi:hypothetical protein B0H13DRAFT_1874951 [Mycena leptocephala]|nr:hypothetical protein B0H13DRAFT_1874951 [Mycena leptocephala]